jgi:hypothetical protein
LEVKKKMERRLRCLRNLETGGVEDVREMSDGEAREKNYQLFLVTPRKRWEPVLEGERAPLKTLF